jgi:hypothetical protein
VSGYHQLIAAQVEKMLEGSRVAVVKNNVWHILKHLGKRTFDFSHHKEIINVSVL